MKRPMKVLAGLALVVGATLAPLGTAQADCRVLQKLVNDGVINQTSRMQVGGQLSLQTILMNRALCSRVTQELVNEGVINQSGAMQVGGLQTLQLLVIGD